MSLTVNMHLHTGASITTCVQEIKGQPDVRSAFVKLSKNDEQITIFFDNIEAIDQMAFELGILAIEARQAWQASNQDKGSTAE